MSERIEHLKSMLSIESIPGAGTALAVELPLGESVEKSPGTQSYQRRFMNGKPPKYPR